MKSINELARDCAHEMASKSPGGSVPHLEGASCEYGFVRGYQACIEREVDRLKKENAIYEAALLAYAAQSIPQGFLSRAQAALNDVKTLREGRVE